jgi:hypothetical protein
MSPLTYGVIAGLVFGALSAVSMLPMQFPDKKAALLGAFANRFGIGLLIPLACVALPGRPGWAIGLAVGVLLSLPSAIITRAFGPIIGIGLVGGAVIGALA